MITLDKKFVSHQAPHKALLSCLSCFQRLLLVTDGTVTELLEQYLEEPIKVYKLYEKIEADFAQLSPNHETFIHLEQMPVLKREVLLQGKRSHKNWLYAETSVLLNHLPQGFRTDLVHSLEPIGKLWAKYRTETYKTILCSEKKRAGALAEYFNIHTCDDIISRTYGVYSNQKLVMVITEAFPATFFTDK